MENVIETEGWIPKGEAAQPLQPALVEVLGPIPRGDYLSGGLVLRVQVGDQQLYVLLPRDTPWTLAGMLTRTDVSEARAIA